MFQLTDLLRAVSVLCLPLVLVVVLLAIVAWDRRRQRRSRR